MISSTCYLCNWSTPHGIYVTIHIATWHSDWWWPWPHASGCNSFLKSFHIPVKRGSRNLLRVAFYNPTHPTSALQWLNSTSYDHNAWVSMIIKSLMYREWGKKNWEKAVYLCRNRTHGFVCLTNQWCQLKHKTIWNAHGAAGVLWMFGAKKSCWWWKKQVAKIYAYLG